MLWFVTVHCERLPSSEQLVIFLHRKFPDILNNHQKAVLTEKNEKFIRVTNSWRQEEKDGQYIVSTTIWFLYL